MREANDLLNRQVVTVPSEDIASEYEEVVVEEPGQTDREESYHRADREFWHNEWNDWDTEDEAERAYALSQITFCLEDDSYTIAEISEIVKEKLDSGLIEETDKIFDRINKVWMQKRAVAAMMNDPQSHGFATCAV